MQVDGNCFETEHVNHDANGKSLNRSHGIHAKLAEFESPIETTRR
jgi:hypothetical protein